MPKSPKQTDEKVVATAAACIANTKTYAPDDEFTFYEEAKPLEITLPKTSASESISYKLTDTKSTYIALNALASFLKTNKGSITKSENQKLIDVIVQIDLTQEDPKSEYNFTSAFENVQEACYAIMIKSNGEYKSNSLRIINYLKKELNNIVTSTRVSSEAKIQAKKMQKTLFQLKNQTLTAELLKNKASIKSLNLQTGKLLLSYNKIKDSVAAPKQTSGLKL